VGDGHFTSLKRTASYHNRLVNVVLELHFVKHTEKIV